MSPYQILIASAIGLSAGLASGLFGIGGGVIIVPLLLYFFNYQQQTATATSLIALVLPVGLLGILNYYRAGFVQIENIRLGLVIALVMFLGTFLGSKFATAIHSATLTKMFSIFLILIAVRLWLTAK